FHIALQSGCDATLAAMGRRYTTDIYRETLGLIRGLVPDAAITTDLIVGFPGESDRDFDDSCRFIEACGLAAVHVFPYSPRPGTAASGMCPQVPPKDKRQRVAKALSLARTVARKFRESAVGSVHDVLWEAETAPGSGIYSGFTSNYLRVFIRSGKNIANQVLRARITRYHGDKLWTELV
ncbi:MAG: tRNA (N(6)-L-threonylcarbamoyladenosine(37)-C(2))-methylthiotransferase MtaB, partial [Dehalococcoidia bacterium]|nr:tRNA (N(6)-L-threonylcarbamoyladenosine(37)-C(2))-methylthiotransferase MtaB [Dehalococcoidia bacterium]